MNVVNKLKYLNSNEYIINIVKDIHSVNYISIVHRIGDKIGHDNKFIITPKEYKELTQYWND